MTNTYRPRRILAVLAAIALPAVTCGIAPALQDLLQRMELMEGRAQRLERFVANAHLPPVLMDEHNIVIGTVLDYSDMFLYASIDVDSWVDGAGGASPWANEDAVRMATIQYALPGRAPVVLEANREQLLTLGRGFPRRLFFESTDCTGVPWTEERIWGWNEELGKTVFSRAWIGSPGKTLYALFPDTPPRFPRIRSQLWSVGVAGQTQSQCKLSGGLGEDLYPFEPVADLSVYTPPFRLVEQRELWGW